MTWSVLGAPPAVPDLLISDPGSLQPSSGVGSEVFQSPQITGARRHGACLSLVAALALAALVWTSCSLVNQDLPNESPVVQVRVAEPTVVSRGGRVALTVTASDEDDDPLRYEWTALGAGNFTDSLSGTTFWIAPTQIVGNSEFFLLSVTIIDSQPETEDPVETFLIEVVQRPPVLTAPGDTVVSFREPEILLEASATDADDDALTFEWEILEGGLSEDRLSLQTQTGDDVSTLRLTTLEPGEVILAVSTTDGSDTIRTEFNVSVTAPALPEGGTATLDLPLENGTRRYRIDVYEYPNQKGVDPLLVENWFEADALCQARDMRLCAREEWVYACGGPENLRVSSTDDPNSLPDEFGLRFCNEIGSDLWGDDSQDLEAVAPAGSFPNCTSGTGVYDLTGNAMEWMQEWVPPEPNAITTAGVGRRGAFSLSSTIFTGASCTVVSSLGLIQQLEGDLPRPTPQSFVDSVLSVPIDPGFVIAVRSAPNFSGYFTDPGLRRGFRCCR